MGRLDSTILILLLIAAVILSLTMRFLGKTMRLMTTIFMLLLLAGGLLTYQFYIDITSMRNGFISERNTFILYDDGEVYTAVTLKPYQNWSIGYDSVDYYSQDQLSSLALSIDQNNFSINDNFKTLIVTKKLLESDYSLEFGVNLTHDEMITIITAQDPYQPLIDKLQLESNASEESLRILLESSYESPDKVKGYLFLALITNFFSERNKSLIQSLKSEDLKVRPEPLSFRVLKHLPV